ncbi:AraC family transcriptional regulator [Enterococcus asini]|uniref:AraC family transcriptional regulator n=1 Tax=Enterococcus asini TaxID=57732 RepID=UPI0026DC44F4|nr:AraC family transcriptional regulator [Enterococcus asini]
MHIYEVDKVLLENDFAIEYKKGTDHKMDRPHFHDGFEIHFTLNNRTQYYIDERKYVGNMGSIAIFNPQEIHRVVIEEGIMYERYVILFKPYCIESIISEYPDLIHFLNDRYSGFANVIQLKNKDRITLVNLFNEIIQIRNNPQAFLRELNIKVKFVEILLLLNEYYSKGDQFENTVARHKDHEVKEIISFMKNHYQENIDLNEICKRFYISKSTLTRVFKNNVGMTPSKYLGYVRIIEARKLLKEGYSIKAVAVKVGFSDDSTFIKKFKNIQGISPKQYALQEKRRNHF